MDKFIKFITNEKFYLPIIYVIIGLVLYFILKKVIDKITNRHTGTSGRDKKKDTIIYAKPLWLTKFKDRNSFIKAIDIMIYFYNDVLLFKLGCDLKYFNNYYDDVTNINGSIDEIIKKMKILIENEYLLGTI